MNDPDGQTFAEMEANVSVLILAGSETSATALDGMIYYLCRNPSKLSLLCREVRTTFTAEDQITVTAIAEKCKYLDAVVNEGLRLFPPVPTAFSQMRVVPPEGHVICGAWVPGGTRLSASSYAAFRTEKHWRDAEMFVPERWLVGDSSALKSTEGKLFEETGDELKPSEGALETVQEKEKEDSRGMLDELLGENWQEVWGKYRDDKRKTAQPFGLGPRGCIGKTLAYAEMRLILARFIFNFDVELEPGMEKWLDGMKSYIVWEKPPLMVRLKPVGK